ncbi:MAG: DUF4412 domain-containing protein [Bacteroidetes bacterium]|nr:DUF4412 domain-containing protein [Bacteroidota bacterium]
MIQIKRTLTILAVSSFTGTAALSQDLSFNMEVTSAKQKDPIIMKVMSKGTKVVIQPQFSAEQGKMSIIVDQSTKKQYMLMDGNGQKMAMKMDMTDFDKATDQAKDPKITITKETKVIDSYKCTKVITETDENICDMWLTQDVGLSYSDLYKMVAPGKGPQGGGAGIPALKNVKGFPIQMIVKDKKKDETVTVNIRNISKAKVDEKVFSLEGYQVMDMGNMKH